MIKNVNRGNKMNQKTKEEAALKYTAEGFSELNGDEKFNDNDVYEAFLAGVDFTESQKQEVSGSFEWIESYLTEDKLEYRIPSYKVLRFYSLEQFYLEKMRENESQLLEIIESQGRSIERQNKLLDQKDAE